MTPKGPSTISVLHAVFSLTKRQNKRPISYGHHCILRINSFLRIYNMSYNALVTREIHFAIFKDPKIALEARCTATGVDGAYKAPIQTFQTHLHLSYLGKNWAKYSPNTILVHRLPYRLQFFPHFQGIGVDPCRCLDTSTRISPYPLVAWEWLYLV